MQGSVRDEADRCSFWALLILTGATSAWEYAQQMMLEKDLSSFDGSS
jgi:hypothetical protein